MTDPTLFGYLASRFASSPENLATEALAFLLGKSSQARAAMLSIPAASGLDFGTELSFRTQVTDVADQAIPDLVGFDQNGRQALIVEAKFWAGLTINQPNAYWGRLSATEPSVLMFLAPTKRLPTLWPELVRLLRAEVVPTPISNSPGVSAARDAEGRMLLLVGWPRLLGAIQAGMEAARESQLLEDLHQLQGLCARMDDEAFLPLGSAELTDLRSARRYLQFTTLVDDLVDAGVREGMVSIQGFRTVDGRGFHTRYLSLAGHVAMIQCDLGKWIQLQETPFWLTVWEPVKGASKIRTALQALAVEMPPRMFNETEHPNRVTIPLRAPIGVERPEVVGTLLEQVRVISTLVAPVEVGAAGVGPEVEPLDVTGLGSDASSEAAGE